MDELLKQALYLTVVGMGMTFLAIGALVASMYLMTAFIKDRPAQEEEPLEEAPLTMPTPAKDERYLAAAAAVAVALATQAATVTATGSSPTADWSAYIRRQHLSARQRYEARKCR